LRIELDRGELGVVATCNSSGVGASQRATDVQTARGQDS